MVDRISRDRAALLLRRFAASRISNDDFVDAYPSASPDPAIRVVHDRSWALYSDLWTHYLHAQPALRHEIARWVLFLASDVEYTWPRFRYIRLGIPRWLNWLSCGALQAWQDRPFERFAACGDIAVWPFRSQSEFLAACESPRFLKGRP